jgi:glycolate oxidase
MELTPAFLRELESIVGRGAIVSSPEGRLTYEADMHTFYKGMPDVVVLPETAEHVAALVRLCRRDHVPIVPRGSGTGLIGGAMAPVGGIMIGLNRMNRILELDFANRCATVQPGLINLWLSQATLPVRLRTDLPARWCRSAATVRLTRGPHCPSTASRSTTLSLGRDRAGDLVWLVAGTSAGRSHGRRGARHARPGTAAIVRLLHVLEGVKTLLAPFSLGRV